MAQVKTSLRKFTTIEELEKISIGPVWVLNTTERIGETANLVTAIPKANGNGSDVLRIPKSFVPFDLTEQVTRAQLMGSSEFRNTLRKGLLKLVSPEYAKALLSTPEGKEEKRRLDNKLQQAMMMTANDGVVADDNEDQFFDPNNMGDEQKKSRKTVSEDTKAREKLSAVADAEMKVQNMVARAENEQWTQVAIIGAIRNIGKVSGADIKYMLKSFNDKPKVKAHLTALKEKLKAKAKAAKA